jgi:hypothetical protein
MGFDLLGNIGDLGKPATVLIEKISDAVGGIYRPRQIRRIAAAEADAERIKAVANIEISEMQAKALHRLAVEEAQKQENMEAITAKALPQLKPGARPEDMDRDWITNFFDKARLYTAEDMQLLWAKVLAGEANNPGSFSRRTVNLLGSMDRHDADAFTTMCRFSAYMPEVQPLVFQLGHPTFAPSSNLLFHLEGIGLVTLSLSGYFHKDLSRRLSVTYFSHSFTIHFPSDANNNLDVGHLLFTRVGTELASICRAEPVDGFVEYIAAHWRENGLDVTLP